MSCLNCMSWLLFSASGKMSVCQSPWRLETGDSCLCVAYCQIQVTHPGAFYSLLLDVASETCTLLATDVKQNRSLPRKMPAASDPRNALIRVLLKAAPATINDTYCSGPHVSFFGAHEDK